ncbi:hypothetical protein P0Y43_07505 [Pseudomonas entomophila]|uniref:hypothetical protein n=1 Tax=Pseudomonas entomophila TaxID=312306 RepID=UPI0023D7C9C7|nr:hypothetical protein [Pseudomonas entomophila]MDF0730580.1 hypothetical protein [Pseudomonas entomophila]
MHLLVIEVDGPLYQLLEHAAQANHLSVEGECLRRLQGAPRQSSYLQALLAELRADEEQRLASANDQLA